MSTIVFRVDTGNNRKIIKNVGNCWATPMQLFKKIYTYISTNTHQELQSTKICHKKWEQIKEKQTDASTK